MRRVMLHVTHVSIGLVGLSLLVGSSGCIFDPSRYADSAESSGRDSGVHAESSSSTVGAMTGTTGSGMTGTAVSTAGVGSSGSQGSMTTGGEVTSASVSTSSGSEGASEDPCELACSAVECGPALDCPDCGSCEADEQCVSGQCEAMDTTLPEGMVEIPSGMAWVGCDPQIHPRCTYPSLELRQHHVDRFRADRLEVTAQQYATCVEAGACGPAGVQTGCTVGTAGKFEHPANCVRYQDASDYCRWVGKRLPTEFEWSKLARGPGQETYPWGWTPDSNCDLAITNNFSNAGCGTGSTWPVGSVPDGASLYGILNVAGNVAEWTMTPSVDLMGDGSGEQDHFVVRGRDFHTPVSHLTYVYTRRSFAPDTRLSVIGFRCVQDVGP